MIVSTIVQESLTAYRMSLTSRMKIVDPPWTGYDIHFPENLPAHVDFVDLY